MRNIPGPEVGVISDHKNAVPEADVGRVRKADDLLVRTRRTRVRDKKNEKPGKAQAHGVDLSLFTAVGR